MEYKDFLGNDITVGSYVAYAVRTGNRASMKMGRVVELTSIPPSYYQKEPTSAIKIVSARKRGKGLENQKNGKPVELTHLNRMVVIRDVPNNIEDILSGKEDE